MKYTSRHEAILESMSDAVYVIDRGMRIQYANPAAERLTGYLVSESIGRNCDDIFCERSYRCTDQCPPQAAMRGQAPILHREAETRTKYGDVRQTQISFSPVFENDECTGAVVVIKDITDLKAAEEKLQRQNKFLTAVIDALPHPFTVIDAETYKVKLANDAANHSTLPDNMACHELSHKSARPCNSSDPPCPIEKVRETGLPVMLEHRHCDSNGLCRDFEVHGYPILDDKGKLTQMIEYCIDVSERKHAQSVREKLINELQQALNQVKTLSGLLPICSSCKKIRDDKGYWNNLEKFISEHSDAEFSHGICPDCAQKLYPKYIKK